MDKPIVLGAVIYDPKVTIIWGIIRDFFEENRCPLDVVFYSNYGLQVDGLAKGHLEVAWNSPLAWLDVQRRAKGTCRALAMRDTDCDRVSHVVVRKGKLKTLADLKGQTVGLGAWDSPQATLIPLQMLAQAGLEAGKAFTPRRFDKLVGLHGDHIGGELDAFRALEKGEVQASVMLDLNFERWSQDGTINTNEFAVLATTPKFDHCNFSVNASFPKDREQRFLEVLFSMTYSNPKHKEMMDMEGLKEWKPGRTSGYRPLETAVEAQRFFETVAP
jgi:ABC-type phosphate/phosphonate transport system substrate-binding protein